MNALAKIGHNANAFDVARDTLADLLTEAQQWLDGAPVETAEHAQGLRLLQDNIRAAHKEGDAARMASTKPHRDAEAAINADWKPILAPAKTALDVLALTLGKWQAAEQRKADEAARIAREAASKAQREAEQARRTADTANLAERNAAEAKLAEAERLSRAADRGEATPVGVKSVTGGRRSALIMRTEAVAMPDPAAALRWCKEHQPHFLKVALLDMIHKGRWQNVPGVTYETTETVR